MLSTYVFISLTAVAAQEAPQSFAIHTLSEKGSSRATAYAASNKLVTLGELTHVAWLDSISLTRVCTYNNRTGELGPVYTIGEGHDNHGGPSMCADSEGYLHIVYGPHHHPFQYRRSLRPNDASEWTEVVQFAEKATYPSLVCDSEDTLHVTYRRSGERWQMVYQKKPKGQDWGEPVVLLESSVPDYMQWGNALAIDQQDRLHLGFHIYSRQKHEAGFAFGYWYSDNHGKTWRTSGGDALSLPVTDETCRPLESSPDMDIRVGNVVCSEDGTVFMTVNGKKGGTRHFELWRLRNGQWDTVQLLPAFPPEARALGGTGGTVSVGSDGTVYIAAAAGSSEWGGDANEIYLLTSGDGGSTFSAQPTGTPEPDETNWLPNIERNMGHAPVDVPHFVFTHGGPGERNDAPAATEVRFVSLSDGQSKSGKILYNGIELPEQWPPAGREPTRAWTPPPYLDNLPNVIPIDVGRQLFVDEFLVESTTLVRTHHPAKYYPANPVLIPEEPWETETQSHDAPAPTAMVFSDGVWYDPADKLFKIWYMAGYCDATAYATSTDGITWQKPELDVVPGTNIVQNKRRDSNSIWLDLDAEDPGARYKMACYMRDGESTMELYQSADGVHWGEPIAESGRVGDRSTFFRNPFRDVWVFGLRHSGSGCGRIRRYWEHADFVQASQWQLEKAPFWTGGDVLDPPREDLDTPPELYNLDAVAYESLLLGLFTIWPGQPGDRAKPNYLCAGFSRDGFHWDRPMRSPFIPVSERYGDWNWGNVQSAGGCCLVAGDKLYFYVSGRSGVKGSKASGTSATGLATLRRDGFTSMDAGGQGGSLTTRPVVFSGTRLFVNVDAPRGALRAEVLDKDGNVIEPFTAASCVPVSADTTLAEVRWNGAEDLSGLKGRPVRFRFSLTNGRLYAFWVSPDESGASQGYVAAGGPGFTGARDTAGRAAYGG